MISSEASKFILDNLKPSFIFSSHDHYGCSYKHNNITTEYTIRSMMGDFSGHTSGFQIEKDPNSPNGFKYTYFETNFIYFVWISVWLVSIGIWIIALLIFLIFLSIYKINLTRN